MQLVNSLESEGLGSPRIVLIYDDMVSNFPDEIMFNYSCNHNWIISDLGNSEEKIVRTCLECKLTQTCKGWE